MTDNEIETFVVFIEHLLSVIDKQISAGTDGCQICENARFAVKVYREERRHA